MNPTLNKKKHTKIKKVSQEQIKITSEKLKDYFSGIPKYKALQNLKDTTIEKLELGLIYLITLDNTRIKYLENYKFTQNKTTLIFQAIQKLQQKKTEINVSTIRSEMVHLNTLESVGGSLFLGDMIVLCEEEMYSSIPIDNLIQSAEDLVLNKINTKLKKFKIPRHTSERIKNMERIKWYVKDWIPQVGVVLLTADKGVGKTKLIFRIIGTLAKQKGFSGDFFKTDKVMDEWVFCFMERHEAIYRDMWESVCGDDIIEYWRWFPSDTPEAKETPQWTLENIELYLSQNPKCKVIVLDRVDMIVKNTNKTGIRDALLKLDMLAIKHQVLFLCSRHTSKPTGDESRSFKERTDGFKEWVHTPSVCLMLHAYQEDRLILFKQYANECKNTGLIEFEWKATIPELDLAMPEFLGYKEDITYQQIEKKYNPKAHKKEDKTENESNKVSVYEVMKQYGERTTAIRTGSIKPEEVFKIPSKKMEEICKNLHYIYTTFRKKLDKEFNGFTLQEKKQWFWYCPIKQEDKETTKEHSQIEFQDIPPIQDSDIPPALPEWMNKKPKLTL